MTESEICKKIYQLLTACGAESEIYKKLFLRDVMKASTIEADEFKTLSIFSNYVVDGQIIDLIIETARRLIPIAVKLEGRDRPAQCLNYLNSAKNFTDKDISAQIYYLTPLKQTSGNNEIILISFGEEILTWLKNCLDETQTELFRTVINSFIAEIETVAKIKNDFDAETRELYEFLMLEIFETLDKRLDENFCKKYTVSKVAPNDKIFKGNYREGIEKYYDSVYSKTPEIIFRYSGENWKRRNYDILFCIGLDDGETNCLCGGWYLFDTKLKQICANIPAKMLVEVKNLFKVKLPKNTGVLIKKFLPSSKNFNFTKKNDDVDALFDDKNFTKAINSIFSAIDDLAASLRR